MAEDDSSMILLVVVVLIAVIGLGLALASFATNESMTGMMGGGYGGGMMNRTNVSTSTPGGLEWGVLLVSAMFLVVAVVLLLRTRHERMHLPAAVAAQSAPERPVIAPVAAPQAETSPSLAQSGPAAVPEPTLVKLLDEDEKRMYLELRDHGGQMYQRDLVALGIFSKPKVTRVLDKMEAKGLVVREAHGMTNLVRLVNQPAK